MGTKEQCIDVFRQNLNKQVIEQSQKEFLEQCKKDWPQEYEKLTGIMPEFAQYQEAVEELYKISWKVASTILIQSTLTAIITEALYNFGIRSWIQRYLVKRWVKKRNSDNYKQAIINLHRWTGTVNGASLYALRYQQLCGQIANALRNQLDYGEGDLVDIFAKNADPEDLERLKNKNAPDLSEEEQNDLVIVQERVLYYADRGLDDLQITLDGWGKKVDYLFSVVISFLLLEFLLTPPTTWMVGENKYEIILSLFCSLISGLLAPTIRSFLLNLIYKK